MTSRLFTPLPPSQEYLEDQKYRDEEDLAEKLEGLKSKQAQSFLPQWFLVSASMRLSLRRSVRFFLAFVFASVFVCLSAHPHKSSAFCFSLWERQIACKAKSSVALEECAGAFLCLLLQCSELCRVNSKLLGIEKIMLQLIKGRKLHDLPKNSSPLLRYYTCMLLQHAECFLFLSGILS